MSLPNITDSTNAETVGQVEHTHNTEDLSEVGDSNTLEDIDVLTTAKPIIEVEHTHNNEEFSKIGDLIQEDEAEHTGDSNTGMDGSLEVEEDDVLTTIQEAAAVAHISEEAQSDILHTEELAKEQVHVDEVDHVAKVGEQVHIGEIIGKQALAGVEKEHVDDILHIPPEIKQKDSVTKQEDNNPVEVLDALAGVEKEHVDDILNDKQQILPIPPEMEHKVVEHTILMETMETSLTHEDIEVLTTAENNGLDERATISSGSLDVRKQQIFPISPELEHKVVEHTMLTETMETFLVMQDSVTAQ